MIQDLRYSVRQLIKSPGFTLTAVLSLALGIGATTAVFSVIYAALLDPYPFPAAGRIVRMSVRTKDSDLRQVNLNIPQIHQVRQAGVIEDVLAMDYHSMTLGSGELPENVNVIGLISSGFDALGLPAIMGRGLAPADAIDGQEPRPVALVSYLFWQEHLAADPLAVGKTLELNRAKYTIVGVAAPRFRWYSADVYLPLKMTADPDHYCIVDFRLRKGVSHQAANAALQPLLEQFAREAPKRFPDQFKVQVEGLNEWVDRSISGTLYLLFGAVGLLLAIGCGNVSILLLAQGTARQQEFSVRAALGAHGRRIVRQLLTESVLLAALGVIMGVLASYGILAIIKAVLPQFAFAPEVVIRINIPVLVFSAVVAAVTALVFGSWPALQLARTQAGQILVSNARRVAGSVRGRRAHNGLIALQIALTLVLLAAAGSAMKGFMQMLHTPLGYDPQGVMSVGIPLRENSYTTWAVRGAYFEQLRAKVTETPGVTMAAISSNATPPSNGSTTRFDILGQPSAQQQTASLNLISPEYFAVLRIPLREGRIWDAPENRSAARVAVVNRTLARRYFPNGSALGHSLKLPELDSRRPGVLLAENADVSWIQIVGVVEDARNDGLAKPIQPAVYVPYTVNMWMGTQILVRTLPPPLTLLRAVRLQLTRVDPAQQSFSRTQDLESWISGLPEWQQQRLTAWIFGVFGALALALAGIGLFSVVMYTVAQRTNEFGIRMALGAQPGHVLAIVFGSTLASVGAGLVTGLVLTLVLNRVLTQFAQGGARDPWILLAGAVLLVSVAGVACAVPAWRACRVDPMTALRAE